MGATNIICFGSEPFIFLALYTISSHVSIVPQLILRKLCMRSYNSTVCQDLDSGKWTTEENTIHEEAAVWNLYFYLAFTIPSIFTCGLLGYLYDYRFRTKLLLVVPVTMALQAIVYIISSSHMELHVGYLIFGSFINSVCGDIQGSIMLSYAYMADITNKDERRSLRMAITESSVFLGQATGSLFSGFLLQSYGFTAVFGASLAASILNFIYAGVILPTPEKADELAEGQSLNTGQVKSFCSDICGTNLRIFLPLLLAVALTNMAVLGENEVIVLYLKHQPLAMLAREIGLYLGILHIGRGIGAAVNAFILAKVFVLSDYIIAMFGLTSLVVTHVAVSLVHSKTALYLTSCLSLTAPLAMSSFRSIATKTVSENQHGMALSLIAMISMTGLTIATVVANKVYQLSTKRYPGMAVLLLAFFSGTALIINSIMLMRDQLYRRLLLKNSAIQGDDEEELPLIKESTPFMDAVPISKEIN